jgi:hypothetical protein
MYFLNRTVNGQRGGTEVIKMGVVSQQRAFLPVVKPAPGPLCIFYVVWDLRLSWPPARPPRV